MTEENPNDMKMPEGDWFEQVDDLAGQVKMLALNLAISLARTKNETKELAYLEPEFTKLIHGSVEVIKEIMDILKALRNKEKMVYSPPSESGKLDRIETALYEILNRSQNILKTISDIKKKQGKVDNYR
jgi:methyl-accepting chemotaxis protein